MTNAAYQRKRKFAYRAKVAAVFAAAVCALAAGGAVVSVNCHNKISVSQITLFDIRREGDGVIVTVMDREFEL